MAIVITALDKEQIQGLTLQQAVEKMRGPVNSPITLTIVRKGVDDPFDVKVIRDVIHIKPVKYEPKGRRRLYANHHASTNRPPPTCKRRSRT